MLGLGVIGDAIVSSFDVVSAGANGVLTGRNVAAMVVDATGCEDERLCELQEEGQDGTDAGGGTKGSYVTGPAW